MLASSDRISSWTPLKPQHSNPKRKTLANQLWCIDFLTPPTPLMIPSQTPCLPWISYYHSKNWCSIHARCSKSSLKHSMRFCGIFSKFKTEFYLPIVLLKCPHVQIAFLKFTSCDNQALVGCIPIPAVAVQLKLKIIQIGQSFHQINSNNILNFKESTTNLNVCTKKSGNLLITPRIKALLSTQVWVKSYHNCSYAMMTLPLNNLQRLTCH